MEKKLQSVIFYTIDKSIRSYRQYAQKQLKRAGLKITIDQWLVLKTIEDNPDIKQYELGDKIFKDVASVTRIIELLVNSGYLERRNNASDRRRANLSITRLGKQTIDEVEKIVIRNRAHALAGISSEEVAALEKVLTKIMHNCLI